MIIIRLLFCLSFIYLAISILYLLVMAVAGRFGKLPVYRANAAKKRIAVIIPAYKEDAVIEDAARSAAAHNYPQENYCVVVVADSLQPGTITQLRQLQVTVLEVSVKMKAASVHAALQYLSEDKFDIAMILDADNVMADDCLEKINDAFQKGCLAIQCHRTAKNQESSIALLEAISEEININLFRRGPAVAGISASPIGSGMAFAFGLLKQVFNVPGVLASPGEDREIEMQLMKQQIFMHFIEDAYVYDEKVSSAAVFEKQRVRWLEAQINQVKRFFDADMKTAPKTITYFAKFFQNLILPRLLLIVVLGLIGNVMLLQWAFSFNAILLPPPVWWIILMAVYAVALLLCVPARFYRISTIKAIIQLPVLVLAMLKALLKIKKDRKEFLHTSKQFRR